MLSLHLFSFWKCYKNILLGFSISRCLKPNESESDQGQQPFPVSVTSCESNTCEMGYYCMSCNRARTDGLPSHSQHGNPWASCQKRGGWSCLLWILWGIDVLLHISKGIAKPSHGYSYIQNAIMTVNNRKHFILTVLLQVNYVLNCSLGMRTSTAAGEINDAEMNPKPSELPTKKIPFSGR